MLTPQEVKSHAFQRASFGGYHMGQVDEFLDILTEDYAALYNDNAVLKSKMKVLVDKVEEYRSTEEAMRKALMTAQRMADDLVKEAEAKRATILAEAEAAAAARVAELQVQVEDEEFRLTTAQEKTAAFVEKIRGLYTEQVTFLAQLDQLAPVRTEPAPDPVDTAANEIDDNVQRLLAKAMAEATAENVKAQVEAEEAEEEDLDDTAEFQPIKDEQVKTWRREERKEKSEEDVDFEERTMRINFGDLQFGKDYEIK